MRSAYAAAKHALHGFFDCLRAEVSPQNIKVTILTPGYIKTNVALNAITKDGYQPRQTVAKYKQWTFTRKSSRSDIKSDFKGQL